MQRLNKLSNWCFVTLTWDFTSITYHVFKFSFKLFVRPSNFEEHYKIYLEITKIGTYIKTWWPPKTTENLAESTKKPTKSIQKLTEATETNNKRAALAWRSPTFLHVHTRAKEKHRYTTQECTNWERGKK